jgi:YD repeat-containing protein
LSDSTGRTTSSYDAKSRLTQFLNPDAKRVSYAYDVLDRRSRLRDADGGRFTYLYDAGGHRSGGIDQEAIALCLPSCSSAIKAGVKPGCSARAARHWASASTSRPARRRSQPGCAVPCTP